MDIGTDQELSCLYPAQDITLDIPKYRILGMHMQTGKLDWVLLKNMKVRGQGSALMRARGFLIAP